MTTESQYITYEQAKDLFATKGDLAELETRIVKWMAGLQLASTGLIITIILLVIRLFGTN